jgi:PAS domain-containing protein
MDKNKYKRKRNSPPDSKNISSRLENDAEMFSSNEMLSKLSEAVATMMVILNRDRQIVYANKLFLDFLNLTDNREIIGKRPGEAVGCLHTLFQGAVCGTSKFCRTCGSLGAILESHMGEQTVNESRITTCDNEAMDFRVTATPYSENGDQFTIFAIHDISNEKRRQILERVFFHDVMNTAGTISGLSAVLQSIENQKEKNEIAKTIQRVTEDMMNEIESQRHLTAAERNELIPEFQNCETHPLLVSVAEMYSGNQIADGKEVMIEQHSENLQIETDPLILRRVLHNMVKNALEATSVSSAVRLSCEPVNNSVVFSVRNDGLIESDVQLQLFKRSFSTKGRGRGIGTYSMKLFGEKYLKGKVWFESSVEKGTTFHISVPANTNTV